MSDFEIQPIPVADTRALRQAVLRPHESLKELARGERPDAFAAGALRDGELIAVGMIAPDGDHRRWRVRGMATAAEARRRGAGSAVLAALLEHACSHGATYIWCNARVPALSLYERAGFRAASEPFELPHIGPHVVVEWRPRVGAAGNRASASHSTASARARPARRHESRASRH